MLFISYRRADTSAYADWISEWLEESLPVSEVFYDRDSIEPAINWRETIQQVIPQCQGMLVLIGPTWLGPRLFELDDTVCHEIALALAHQIPIISILVQGASMPNSGQLPLAIQRLSDINALPLRVGRNNRVHDWEMLRHTLKQQTGIEVRPRNLPDTERVRNVLLRLVREQIKRSKAASLKGLPFMELGLSEQPGVIRPPYYMVYPERPETMIPLPPETTILDVYSNDGKPGSLLILGLPGAGKSTLLLELGEWLLQQAEHDALHTAPVPVLLNLASWPKAPVTLRDWLGETIQESYRLSKEAVNIIFQSIPLLLLLDGLDETPEQARAACIAQVNAYLEDHQHEVNVVISSREKPYLEAQTPLVVEQALHVNPLTKEQVTTYLVRNAPLLDYLQVVLQDSEQLAELARTPLWLNLMAVVYRDISAEVMASVLSQEETQRDLLKRYVAHQLDPQRRAKADGLQAEDVIMKPTKDDRHERLFVYSEQNASKWLAWMAARLVEENKRNWYLEYIQPSWVQRKWRLRAMLFRLGGLAGVFAFGPFFGLVLGLIAGIDYGIVGGILIGIVAGIVGGIAGVIVSGIVGGIVSGIVGGIKQVKITDRLNFSRRTFVFGLAGGLGGGLVSGILFGLIAGISGGVESGISGGIVGGLFGSLFGSLVFGLFSSLSSSVLEDNDYYAIPNLGIMRTGRNALVSMLIGGLYFGLFIGLYFGLRDGLFIGLYFGIVAGLFTGLSSWFSFGLESYIRHWSTRWILAQENAMPQVSPWYWITRLGIVDHQNIDLIIRHDPYIRFLYDMEERNILQKAGNGFAFLHPLLRDYFASIERSNN